MSTYPYSPSSTSRHSSSSTNSYGTHSPPAIVQGDVPTSVHNLLASTKRLQSVLKDWSHSRASVSEVSDVYVQIGTEFNTVIHAFAYHQIDLSDIHSIPQEMRSTLEVCLAEDPSPEILQRYMPELRDTLVKLLKGLQTRQDAWKARSNVQGPTLGGSRNVSPRNSR
ncbi:hypothetical protein BKA70DRAFT_406614 [Coprinopsis sp. MPI-PUGE-AT-0042]|nr:hypothetical protein BKA70DRAFT_406614 [Coprinopsis sp. MPI-PUGE-AT-0042]